MNFFQTYYLQTVLHFKIVKLMKIFSFLLFFFNLLIFLFFLNLNFWFIFKFFSSKSVKFRKCGNLFYSLKKFILLRSCFVNKKSKEHYSQDLCQFNLWWSCRLIQYSSSFFLFLNECLNFFFFLFYCFYFFINESRLKQQLNINLSNLVFLGAGLWKFNYFFFCLCLNLKRKYNFKLLNLKKNTFLLLITFNLIRQKIFLKYFFFFFAFLKNSASLLKIQHFSKVKVQCFRKKIYGYHL